MIERLVLAIALTFAGLATLAACSAPVADARSDAPVAAASVGDVFPSVPEVRAKNGTATVEFHVVLDPASGAPAFEYGIELGTPPTIRVSPGDTIRMIVHNDISRAQPGHPNNINIHFHGLTVSPQAPGDEVLMTLARPKESLRYLVRIPRDQEPGLYWYHPHAHGETYRQVTAGMSGAIVVEGLDRHFPALAAMRERIVILRDVATGPGGLSDDDMPITGLAATPAPRATRRANGSSCRAENQLLPTLDRQPRARIGIRPGEEQFFRVVNASAARYFDLSIDGSRFELVALDGVALDAYPGAAPTRMVRHIVIPPAGRAEFVTIGTAHPTVLRSACYNSGTTGDADPAVVLADLVDPALARDLPVLLRQSPPPATAVVAPAPLRTAATLPQNVLSRPLSRPARHRTIRFSEDAAGFYINGEPFDMGAPPRIVARSGTLEAWRIINDSDEVHAFHVHQVHFVVTATNDAPAAVRNWRDTVSIPPRHRRGRRSVAGTVDVLVDFRDPVVRGTFVFHCHILDHEDQGMMAKIRVI